MRPARIHEPARRLRFVSPLDEAVARAPRVGGEPREDAVHAERMLEVAEQRVEAGVGRSSAIRGSGDDAVPRVAARRHAVPTCEPPQAQAAEHEDAGLRVAAGSRPRDVFEGAAAKEPFETPLHAAGTGRSSSVAS